jgi:spermidine/putrescine transport system permease protein
VKSRRFVALSLVLYVFLYLPLAVVIVSSVNATRFGTSWKGFTLVWYRSAFNNPQVIGALQNTVVLGLASAAIATTLGTLLGYGLARHPFFAKRLVSRAMLFPIAVPDIVMAVALLSFYAFFRSWAGFGNLGLGTMILAHVTLQIPFVAMIVRARLRGTDPALEEAAADLGATRMQRLWHVTLPMLRPGIIAGALLAFTLSLDDFVVSFFTSGAGSTTVPIYIYSSVKRGVTGEVHALSTVLILAAVLATIAVGLLNNCQNQERNSP